MRPISTPRLPQRIATFVLLVVVGSLACAQPGRTPQTASVAMSADHGGWENAEVLPPGPADLGVAPADIPENGYRLLGDPRSAGRFPAAVAVARLRCEANELDGARRIQIDPLPDVEAAYWNHLFDFDPRVRETAFCGAMGLSPDTPRLAEILDGAARMNCALCLVYARPVATENEGQVFGVLFETATQKPVAALRAISQITPAQLEVCREHEADDRVCRADIQAQRQFERTARLLLADLVARDTPAATQPSPWQDDRTIWPRDMHWWFGAVPWRQ